MPLGAYERIKFGYPLENVRFLLLSTNLARKWLQIDTDLLRIITSTTDDFSGGTNIDDLERPWTPKIWVLSDFFCYFRLRRTLSEFSLKYTGDRPGQPAYEIKLMLSRVSWALAQISCFVQVRQKFGAVGGFGAFHGGIFVKSSYKQCALLVGEGNFRSCVR